MKNLNIRAKAWLLALEMAAMSLVPMGVSAEEVTKEVNNTKPVEFVLPRINQSVKQMTFEEFVEGVKKAYTELKRVPIVDTKDKTEEEIKEADVNLTHSIVCLYYLTNSAYLNDIKDQLISEGYISENYIDNMMYAVGLVHTINNYQQKTV